MVNISKDVCTRIPSIFFVACTNEILIHSDGNDDDDDGKCRVWHNRLFTPHHFSIFFIIIHLCLIRVCYHKQKDFSLVLFSEWIERFSHFTKDIEIGNESEDNNIHRSPSQMSNNHEFTQTRSTTIISLMWTLTFNWNVEFSLTIEITQRSRKKTKSREGGCMWSGTG